MADTVIVGCKLPNGLLIEVDGTVVRLNGPARFIGGSANTRKQLNKHVEYNDGLTIVDKAFWCAWLSAHENFTPVKTGHVYSNATRADAIAAAKDTAANKTGLEPFDPKGVKGIIPADHVKQNFIEE